MNSFEKYVDEIKRLVCEVSEKQADGIEKKALEALHGLNNNTYEKVDETYSGALAEVEAKTGELNTANETIETLNGEIANLNTTVETKTAEYDALTETYNTEKSENETKIEELNTSIATLTTERDDAVSQLNVVNNTVTTLTEEVATLNSFKAEIEKKEKEAIVSKYEKLLDAAVHKGELLREGLKGFVEKYNRP